jgi:hypothetical protein
MQDGGLMLRAPITGEQAAVVRQAQAKAAQAQREYALIVSALAAGWVPDGAPLVAIADDGLVFEAVPDAA